MFDAVLFDFDSTLVDLHANDVAAVTALLAAVGLEVDAEQFIELSLAQLEQAFEAGESIDDVHRYRLSRALSDHGVDWRPEHFEVFLESFVSVVPAYAGASEALRWLGGRTRLGMVTNATEVQVQRDRIRASGLGECFDEIVVAGEVGAAKPDPRIFMLAAERLGARATHCLFVGDSEHHDIGGARAVGMTTVRRMVAPGTSRADATFTSFEELPGIVSDLWARRSGAAQVDIT